MKQIEEIKKLTGGRYLIRLDDGSSFPLYGKELSAYGLQEGEALSETVCDAVMRDLLPKRAKICAMHILEKTDKTEFQLRQKLTALCYPEDIIEEAVAYVKKYHYIDDLRYAVRYMEYRQDRKSLRQMEQELYQKGISKEIIQEARSCIDVPDEDSQIQVWLKKKQYQPDTADQKELHRIYNFLLRKGYTSSAIQRNMCLMTWYE